MPYINFVSDTALIECVREVINAIQRAEKNVEKKLYNNVIDPFSAVFEAHYHEIALNDWLQGEKVRQIQKSWQNALGLFHQRILGSISGWENLGTGHVIDIRNREKGIIAEIKNKHNTTKGNHKYVIYDDLQKELTRPEHQAYTGYYVEIIPKGKTRYNSPFTPSDNTQHQQRPSNNRIRIVDGSTFYDLASNTNGALQSLYHTLPTVIADITGKPASRIIADPLFTELFNRAF